MSDTERRAGEGWSEIWAVKALVAYLRRKVELDDTPPRARELFLREALGNLGTLIEEDLSGLPLRHDSSGYPFVELSGLRVYAQRVDLRTDPMTPCWPQILVRCPGCGWEHLSRPIRNRADLGSVLSATYQNESGQPAGDDHAASDCIESELAARPRDGRGRP